MTYADDQPASILIVDDEANNRQLLQVMLEADGFSMRTADRGEKALALIAERPPDLVLLDVMMPGMDGYQVATRIKGDAATSHIPIIMVTALDDHDARMRGLRAGVEDFLTKPVDRAELRVRVRNLLRLKAHGDYYEQRAGDLAEQAAWHEVREERRDDEMRFKDEFLSHVSRELRGPLAAVRRFTSLLLAGTAGELNAQQREYQETVLKNGRQLQGMIDDLLEITAIETGRLSVEPARVSIAEAVADALDTVREPARAAGLAISCDVPLDLAPAWADSARLRQILVVLLDNAIRFTPRGGAVSVRARQRTEDPAILVIEVSDTGTGIAPDVIERLFERNYQPANPAQPGRNGLGLGLYICKTIITRHGGMIWARPGKEGGSVLSFTLLRAPEEAPAAPDEPRSAVTAAR